MTARLTAPELFVLPPQSTRPRSKRGGYAQFPGSGPEGETCGSCANLVRHRQCKVYLKCGLTKWTHGAATDIRARAPACSKWETK